ncbi:hypothetical protein DOTSEDRAFT_47325 [Dothistroma septosporum NZE10]|uniref:Peptidase S54 rhomboid domain-containing protein n=1 Tax=Dothistroma septosporum (strain NZE10 / CBS 128990) TaxID=675120 RepID=N1PCN0_DOTSN|nr:hypothetical protein DOTSEDRAFT_47325 [Dothistroma septosporum NZE10]
MKLLHFLTDNFMLSVDSIKAGRYHTLLTCAFSHVELGHFAFNMFGLFTFGGLMAMAGVGGFHVLAAGIGSAIFGSLAGLYHQQSLQSPQGRTVWGRSGGERTRTLVRSLGASGLVMGLSATATCLMPLAPMSFMFIPIPIPLFALTAVYFGLDAYYLDRGQTRIGHAAHMGGAVFGAVYYFSYLRKYGGVWPMLRRAVTRR